MRRGVIFFDAYCTGGEKPILVVFSGGCVCVSVYAIACVRHVLTSSSGLSARWFCYSAGSSWQAD